MTDRPHLRLLETARSRRYTYPGGGGGGEFRLPPRDRIPHARRLRSELEAAEADARGRREREEAEGEPEGTVIAVRSEDDFQLKLESLERVRSGIALLSVGRQGEVTVANVFVPRGKFVLLLKWIEDYEHVTSPRGKPRNRELVESIASIRLAAVRDFWVDTLEFPGEGRAVWWETWLRVSDRDPAGAHARFAQKARSADVRVVEQFVAFPERCVTLAYGTSEQLGRSLEVLAALSELRQAKEVPTDYVALQAREQAEFIDDAVSRLATPGADAPAVCILDTGVNRGHPLLRPVLAAADMHTVNQTWGTADDERQHGTGMAGIALYGCLTDVLGSSGPIVLAHRLESVKVLPRPPGQNERQHYGALTEQAVYHVEIQAPGRKRAICMAITADDRDLGMPSTWSAAVDQICAGAMDDSRRLMLVSAGNVRGEEFAGLGYRYHDTNCQCGVEDPGQSWNAVTVGAFTEKVMIRDATFAGWNPVGESGGLCPTSRTSIPWEDGGWPLKPDIVLEGGNYAELNGDRSNCEDLSLLTTALPPHDGRLLQITHDTSPATAAGARMAAILWSQYPRLWPETVRALVVHSASWTEAMIRRFPGSNKATVQRRLRCYGYGVPSLAKALWSAENAVTLIFEGQLQPYRKVDSEIRANEMHVHAIPWPSEVLQGMGATDVRLRITLSYFVEPSPGRIGWATKHRYQSHGLRFDVIRPTETEDQFVRRLSRAERDDPRQPHDSGPETRPWVVGEQGRTRGSVHSDWWTGTASDLASCNMIAVFPVTGWWRERPHLERWERAARYSLVVTLETPDIEVDLYTPIENQVAVSTEVTT